jgi:hypothetical protein
MTGKRGQMTIFIIMAVLIVAAVAGYFLIRGSFQQSKVSPNLAPVYNAFLSCVEENTLTGVTILESNGGYIELPEFKKGSAYMPFSSQLNFLGNPIPYWYYVSENNIAKEQVPSRQIMEDQLARYLETKVTNCFLDNYFEQGFEISVDQEPQASVTIGTEDITVDLNMDLGIERANETTIVRDHQVIVKTIFGTLYDSARSVYDYEQSTLFLETYGIDTLRLYAPVDGVELTCSPKIWNADTIFENLKGAIESNTLALRSRGTNSELTSDQNKYFVLDLPVEQDVRFLNSRNWTYSYEVNPSEGPMLIAKPVGNQPGMAAVGFCYVPYHFVYNVNYPVLVQVYDGQEFFQFPMAVVIRGNKPREALEFTAASAPKSDLCEYKNTEVIVNTYDNYLNPVDAQISFQCFGESCFIGETKDGSLQDLFPQCANGFVVAQADGYKRTKEYFSTTSSNQVDVIMNKLYEKQINLKVDGKNYNGDAVITISSNDSSTTILYPGQKTVNLSQDQYEIQVYIYKNTSIKLAEQTQQQCVDVPQSGLLGLFGSTEKNCFDIIIPEQSVSQALSGGGKQNYFISESELETGTTMDINANSLPLPKTADELQQNYILFEEQKLQVNLR